MALESGRDDPGASSLTRSDFVVQAINPEEGVPVDGPIEKVLATSTGVTAPSPDDETSSSSEKLTLESPFHSPKSATEDDMSDTTLDEGEIQEHVPDSSKDSKHSSDEDLEEVAELKEKEDSDAKVNEQPETTNMKNDDFKAGDAENAANDDKVCSPAPRLKLITSDTSGFVVLDPVTSAEDAPKNNQEVTDLGKSSAVVAHASVTEGESAEAEITEHSQPRHSVPPHLRPDFLLPATRQVGVQGPRVPMATPDSPRSAHIPRALHNHMHSQYNAFRSDVSGNELARTRAQLMKTRNELEAERKKSADMRTSVENEKQKVMEAALAVMTTDLLNKQGKTLSHQAKVDAKERELQYREARIEQLEIYLSEGQKQIYRQANPDEDIDEDGLTMADVNREHDRRQAELSAKKHIADMESKLNHRLQTLKLREAAQQMREEQYKALMRGAVEAEVREGSMPEVEAKLAQVADIEYNRGFGAGKEAGRRQSEEGAHERGLLEGYVLCHRSQVTMSKFRQGLIARDSPELDFIFDATHPHNMFTMGARFGEMKVGKEKKQMADGVQHKPVQGERKPDQEQNKPQEIVLQLPAPRPTFASELRGVQTMHKGHYVLANSSGSTSPVATSKANEVDGVSGARDESMGGRVGEGVYEGRRIMQYKETREDNLIDLC